ncbi:DUF1851 domain-containing protein [Listeria booriae]|uniref:T6SS immunity protein Tdi1 domain-containing protein n=1 Tax=Listeria booriae TaxID=1552123 RepID=UPI001627909F|nr:T6SS immunity protein Tdi1 domain-containing protein [Listeria booriae]MBC1897308.1 DUF1851 domain-containing protein [Listeria booriae]MBC2057026.1 DUF1851 domain-containing protein [Listeria booriae]
MSVLEDFKLVEKVSEEILGEYRAKLPEEMINFWTKYGFGTFMEGYFKSVNPIEYRDILEDTSERYTDGIVLFTTGMGDLIIWSEGYVRMLNYRYGIVKTIMSKFKFFFQSLESEKFKNDYLMWNPYQEAVKKLGIPAYDECFGYVPILALGGAEKVENLQKVKLKEHILLISALAGTIE